MIKDFFVFGSCNSRDIFNSNLNPNYKKFFKICGESQRASLISLMSKPIPFENSSTEIFSINDKNIIDEHRTKLLREDLSKNFLKTIKNINADYLLMDNLYEVDCGLLELSDGNLITNSPDLRDSKLYSQLGIKREITIQNNTEEYLKLFEKHCNLFFNFLEKNKPDIKVILNVSRYRFKIIKDNGEIYENNEFKLKSETHNKYRKMLDNHIMKKYDVEILPFDFNTHVLETHPFGYAPSHFGSSYLQEKTKQIKDIIVRNSLLNTDTNIKIRELNKKLVLSNELEYLNNNTKTNCVTISEEEYRNQLKKIKSNLNNEYLFLEHDFELILKNLKKYHDNEFFDEAIEDNKNCNYSNYNDILIKTNNNGTKVYSNTAIEGFHYIDLELDKDRDYVLTFEWVDGNFITPIIQIREVENMNIFTTFQKQFDDTWEIYTNGSSLSPDMRIVDFIGTKSFKKHPINPHDKIKLIKYKNNIKIYCENDLIITYPVTFHSNFYLGFGGHALGERYTIFKNLSIKLIK